MFGDNTSCPQADVASYPHPYTPKISPPVVLTNGRFRELCKTKREANAEGRHVLTTVPLFPCTSTLRKIVLTYTVHPLRTTLARFPDSYEAGNLARVYWL